MPSTWTLKWKGPEAVSTKWAVKVLSKYSPVHWSKARPVPLSHELCPGAADVTGAASRLKTASVPRIVDRRCRMVWYSSGRVKVHPCLPGEHTAVCTRNGLVLIPLSLV